MDEIGVVEDRDKCSAFANMVVSLQGPLSVGKLLSS
jgi:hypothetical protein